MKKSFLFLMTSLAATTAAAFAACNHEHVFDDSTWQADDDYHWHACEQSLCTEQGDKEAHDFVLSEDGTKLVCSVCDKQVVANTAGPHEHVPQTTLTNNNNFHWYACQTEGCTERLGVAEHYFSAPVIEQTSDLIRRTYTCEVCNYQKVETTTIDSIVKDEASWDQAFTNLELINFSMDVRFYEDGQLENTNHCEITETSAYYNLGEGAFEFYTTQNADKSTYTTYVREIYNHTPFMHLNDTSNRFLVGAQKETILKFSYETYYELFEYDEDLGAYVYDGEIQTFAYLPDGTPYDGEMYCYNNVVKVADGKITYIDCDYYFVDEWTESEEYDKTRYKQSFTYYNIGMTTVTVPLNVINNTIPDDGSYERVFNPEYDNGFNDGYEQGTQDGSFDAMEKNEYKTSYNDTLEGNYSQSYLFGYSEGYQEGYNSGYYSNQGEPNLPEENSDYYDGIYAGAQAGYMAGMADAETGEYMLSYNDTIEGEFSAEYINGYIEGYRQGYEMGFNGITVDDTTDNNGNGTAQEGSNPESETSK